MTRFADRIRTTPIPSGLRFSVLLPLAAPGFYETVHSARNELRCHLETRAGRPLMGRRSTPSGRTARTERPDASRTGLPLGRPWTVWPQPERAAWPRKPFVLAALGVAAFVVTFGLTRWRGAMAPGP